MNETVKAVLEQELRKTLSHAQSVEENILEFESALQDKRSCLEALNRKITDLQQAVADGAPRQETSP